MDNPSIEYYPLDITNTVDVNSIIQKTKPDIIINTAAMTNVDQCEDEKERCHDINVKGVKNIVEAAKKTGSFLIHLSTDFIFDGKEGPLDENATPDPVNFYGKSKLESESIIEEAKINSAIVRTVLVYGTGKNLGRSNLVLWVKSQLEDGEVINIVDDQWRTPTLAEDLAEGCFLIAKNKAAGIWHISGNELLTPYEMALRIADFFNLDRSLIRRTTSNVLSQRANRPSKTGFVIEKAKKELGYNPHTFEQGLEILSSQLSV